MYPVTDPGVTVPTGDPESIHASSVAYNQVSAMLADHADAYAIAANAPDWEGESANQYRWLSQQIANACYTNAGEARKAADALVRFGDDLDHMQTRGRQALADAIEWMGQVNSWAEKLEQAKRDVTAAQSALSSAQSAFDSLANQPNPSASTSSELAHLSMQVGSMRQNLQSAEDEVTLAEQRLNHALKEFADAQKRGGKAVEEAEQAAMDTVSALGALDINPPPWVIGGLSGPIPKVATPTGEPELDYREAMDDGYVDQWKNFMDLLHESAFAKREYELEQEEIDEQRQDLYAQLDDWLQNQEDERYNEGVLKYQEAYTSAVQNEEDIDQAEYYANTGDWSDFEKYVKENTGDWEANDPALEKDREFYNAGGTGNPGSNPSATLQSESAAAQEEATIDAEDYVDAYVYAYEDE